MVKNGHTALTVVGGVLVLVCVGRALARQTPPTGYEILRQIRRQQPAEPTGESQIESFTVGPVVAVASLRLVPARGHDPVGYLGMQRSTTTVDKPAELREVPADAPPQPVYFDLKVGDSEVRGITYRSTRGWRRIKLRLDTDGDGAFADEKEYIGRHVRIIQITQTYEFGPVGTRNPTAGAAGTPIHASCSNGQWLVFYPAEYRRGQVTQDGRTYEIAAIDNNFDGRYDEVFEPPAADSREPRSDVFAIDLDGNSKLNFRTNVGDSEIMPLGRLVRIDQRYYAIRVSEDGSSIEFRQAKPAYGALDLGGKTVEIGLWSDAGAFQLKGSDKTWRLPAGRYGIVQWNVTEIDSSGNDWTFTASKSHSGRLGDFEIRPGRTTSFRIGAPFVAKASMGTRGGSAFAEFSLQGQAGELYQPGAKRNGKMTPEPKFKILDQNGQAVESGRFKYG